MLSDRCTIWPGVWSKRVKRHFSFHLAFKLIYQPCPFTVLYSILCCPSTAHHLQCQGSVMALQRGTTAVLLGLTPFNIDLICGVDDKDVMATPVPLSSPLSPVHLHIVTGRVVTVSCHSESQKCIYIHRIMKVSFQYTLFLIIFHFLSLNDESVIWF